MTLFAELQIYLNQNFEGLHLSQPLFFKGFPGLRFDLQDEALDTADDIYFEEVVKRMERIHNAVFDKEDELLVLLQTYTYKRRKIKKHSYLFKLFDTATVYFDFKRSKTPIYKEKGDTVTDRSCKVIFKDKAQNIDLYGLYVGISHADFNRRPIVRGEVYIVNITKGAIMLMYDDRGCDLISKDIDVLKRYYDQLNDLILEANREGIEANLGIEIK